VLKERYGRLGKSSLQEVEEGQGKLQPNDSTPEAGDHSPCPTWATL